MTAPVIPAAAVELVSEIFRRYGHDAEEAWENDEPIYEGDYAHVALSAAYPVIVEAIAGAVEAIPLGVSVEIRKQMVWGEHGGDEIRAKAAAIVRGFGGTEG